MKICRRQNNFATVEACLCSSFSVYKWRHTLLICILPWMGARVSVVSREHGQVYFLDGCASPFSMDVQVSRRLNMLGSSLSNNWLDLSRVTLATAQQKPMKTATATVTTRRMQDKKHTSWILPLGPSSPPFLFTVSAKAAADDFFCIGQREKNFYF